MTIKWKSNCYGEMYLTDGENLQGIHADFWVEKLQFTVTSVNNDLDSINCK